MKPSFVGLVATAALIFGCVPAVAMPAVTAEVSPRDTTVGTPFRYSLTIETESGVELQLPLSADQIGAFLIRDFGNQSQDMEGGAKRTTLWYELVGYDVGDHVVPGLAFQYRDTEGVWQKEYLPDAPVTILSILDGIEAEQNAEATLPPIRDPIHVPSLLAVNWYVVAGTALLSLALAAAALWTRRQRLAGAVSVDPQQVALAELAGIRRSRLADSARFEEHYVRITSVVRRYVEAAFRVRAPEMTTEEFLAAARSDRRLSDAQRSALYDFLREADLVKFARHVPSTTDADRALDAAVSFVASFAKPSDNEAPAEGATP